MSLFCVLISCQTCIFLQTGQVQDSADLPHPVGGVWGAGVCLSVPLHLYRHAFLLGSSQCRGVCHSVHLS